VVASGFVVNPEGKILLYRGPKWGDRWLVPGGHVDYRESLAQAAEREVFEETGLTTKATRCVNVGNLVDDPDYNRATQLVFFHFVCETTSFNTNTDSYEITELAWFTPAEALTLNLGTGMKPAIENYLNGLSIPITETIFPPRD